MGTYEVNADGQLLECAPAHVMPLAQRYFLYASLQAEDLTKLAGVVVEMKVDVFRDGL